MTDTPTSDIYRIARLLSTSHSSPFNLNIYPKNISSQVVSLTIDYRWDYTCNRMLSDYSGASYQENYEDMYVSRLYLKDSILSTILFQVADITARATLRSLLYQSWDLAFSLNESHVVCSILSHEVHDLDVTQTA